MNNIEEPQVGKPILKKNVSISPLWIFTLLAFILAGWLLYRSIEQAGEQIEIYFKDAQGIEAGRTTIRYHGLEVGMVQRVTLSDDLKSIYAQADIYPEAKKILHENTIFWVVRPKATLTGVTGLDTLVTGNYIAVQPGKGKMQTSFIAAEEAPKEAFDVNSLHIQLQTADLGSINIGSGIYFRKILVGEVYNYHLSADKQSVTILARIKKEHAALVTKQSRFWNVSGVQAQIGLDGVKVDVENIASIIAGGIAFDSPEKAKPASDFDSFNLYNSINATQRGIDIQISLPKNHGITNPNSAILYQGIEIGRLNGIEFDPSYLATFAKANIDPSMAWTLTSGTKFIIETPRIGLSGFKNVSNFVLGNTLSIQPEKGNPERKFSAKTTENIMATDPNSLKLMLTAKEAWGLNPQTQVIYRGFPIGFVYKNQLSDEHVLLDVIIDSKYKHLVKSNSRFFIVGGISGQINSSGIEVNVPSFAQLAQPAISFTSEGTDQIKDQYTLFKSEVQARNAKNNAQGFKTITLIANKMPSLSQGSPVMYKNFTVGNVTDFNLVKNRVEIKLDIENHYEHLFTKDSVFWNQSGIDIKASLSGVEIDTGSLNSIISGGISFDNIKGIKNRDGRYWKLYDNLMAAENYGLEISFISDNVSGLSKGSHIRYHGVNVGEIIALNPAFQRDNVKITAMIYPEYAEQLAQKSSYFWVAQPRFSLTKTENLDSLFGAYISVNPGKGGKQTDFKLYKSAQYPDGLTLILESENRDSVSVGSPVLFREFEVGAVTDVRLGRFGDRVLIEIKISDDYKHLVRNNTVFWNQSGIDVSIGITGATVRSGSVESIIRGGIAFATPEGAPLAEKAKSDQHFLLYKKPEPQWIKWRTAIPKF